VHKRVQNAALALLDELADESNEWSFHLEDEEWWEHFRYEYYDWDAPAFLRKNRGPCAYRVIQLTQGFFCIVSKHHYRKMTRYSDGTPKKWYAKIDRDRDGNIVAVYARRSGRSALGEPAYVYMHREIMDVLDLKVVVDHVNGFGLDCRGDPDPARSVNLVCVDTGENVANSVRPKKTDLPAGVEYRGRNRKGEKRYGGKICIRHSRKKVTTIRSRRTWLSPQPAARWYLNRLRRRYGRVNWASFKHTVNYPIFPPRKHHVDTEEDIPF